MVAEEGPDGRVAAAAENAAVADFLDKEDGEMEEEWRDERGMKR